MQVIINADEMGNVIRQSENNSEYGFVRVTQTRVGFSNTGWLRPMNLSALIPGKVEDLQSMDWKANQKLNGKIVIKESLEPFNSTNPDRYMKYAGDTGIVCCVDGQPIYRKTMFTADTTAEDTLIAHTNGQDIREANGIVTQAKVVQNTTPEEAFDTVDNQEVEEVNEEDEVKAEAEEVLEEETFEL